MLRVLHTLHLTYAAPWRRLKPRLLPGRALKNAWEDVLLPDAEEGEFESWLKKWDPMTNVGSNMIVQKGQQAT